MLTFKFSGANGVMIESDTLTSGMTGKVVKLEFTSDWENRTKTAVFTAGPTTVDVLNVGEEVVIPHEVLQNCGDRLYVGIYGTAEDGTALPTIYAKGPLIRKGADPSGDESTQATPPVWAQLQTQIDALNRGGTGGAGSGQNVELDTTLTQSGKAADARVVGEKMPIAAEIDDTGLASFKNTAGIVLFTLDLSGLGGDVHFGNVVISAESLRVAVGSTGTFTVCLETAPSHNQPVYLAVSDNIRLSVSPATLTFTPGNYAEPQTVTVTAIQDEDENDDCVTVTLTSRAVDARQVVVTIGDDDKRLVTDGLVLHMDYRNHVDDTADTIADLVNGVTFKNFAQFNKVDGGIYGNGTYKYLTLNTKDDAYSAFLSSMKSGNGFSVEAFGTNIPPSFYLPNYRSLLDDGSSGYSIGATETPVNVGGNPTRILNDGSTEYDGVFVPDKNMTIDGETVNLAQTKNWSKVPHYNSFVHVVHTFSSDGAMGVWVNGHKFGSDAIVENFASWDVDTMFADFSMRNAYNGSETLYTSSQRIYNRVLSEDEINTNMAVEAAKMGLSTF